MKRGILSASLAVLMSCVAFGQSEPAFEVASIKPNTSTDHRAMMRMGGGSEIMMTNFSLKGLIMMAYDVKNYSLTGPDWLDSERFDINAKPPAGPARDQMKPMLRTLLAERFKLAIHRETKTLTGYALMVGKGGLKVKELEESVGDNNGNSGMQIRMGMGQLTASRISMQQLADRLAGTVDRPVADMTKVKGTFAIKLEWAHEEHPGMIHGGAAGGHEHGDGGGWRPADASGPTIFTALQEQLGLRLQSQKVPVEIVIIDHVEKVPTEN